MQIIYTRHARFRMTQKGISEDETSEKISATLPVILSEAKNLVF